MLRQKFIRLGMTLSWPAHWSKGMPGFADPPKFAFPHLKMTARDADAIHDYVVDQAWKAYNLEEKGAAKKAAN
jgi:hypothetical protein